MPTSIFETPDGNEVEVDPDEVVQLRPGEEAETVVIELDDGSEVVVVANELEAAAELGLDPFAFIARDDDDEALEGLVERDYDDDPPEE